LPRSKGRVKISPFFVNLLSSQQTECLSVLKGAMSTVAHALASENKLEKDGPSFSSSVGDFGRLFLAVEISAIVR